MCFFFLLRFIIFGLLFILLRVGDFFFFVGIFLVFDMEGVIVDRSLYSL